MKHMEDGVLTQRMVDSVCVCVCLCWGGGHFGVVFPVLLLFV